MNNQIGFNNEKEFELKKEIFKYLFFWRWFVFSLIFCFLISFFYLRYSHDIFTTSAKIKILDKKETSLELPSASDLFNSNKINLENEIELLSSFTILSKVVQQLNLRKDKLLIYLLILSKEYQMIVLR